MVITCWADQESILIDLTMLTCTPKLRCFPAHSRHITIPWLMLAQSVSKLLQSQHRLLPGYSRISLSTSDGKGWRWII